MVASGFAPALLQKGAPKKMPQKFRPKKGLKNAWILAAKSFFILQNEKSFESRINSKVEKRTHGWFGTTPFSEDANVTTRILRDMFVLFFEKIQS